LPLDLGFEAEIKYYAKKSSGNIGDDVEFIESLEKLTKDLSLLNDFELL